jgi:putative transposase
MRSRSMWRIFIMRGITRAKGNVLLFPTVSQDAECEGPMQCRERLGGLLKYYTREAA